MRYGDEPLLSVNHARLERVVCAGEVLNAPAWDWLQNTILLGRVPVIDHMWQTETSGPIFGNPYGIGLLPIKPGSAAIPLAGIDAEVVTLEGTPCAAGEKGIMVITRPFPGLTAALWGEPERYGRDYWEKIPGRYYTGDSTSIDEDGYVWFGGRADEIIKIAGHRIGTIEVESACLMHPAVAECGVVGRPDETRGEVISAFVLLKNGQSPSTSLKQALLETIRHELGPVAVDRRAELRQQPAQDAQRQDHAARAQGGDPQPRSGRHHHHRRRRLSGRGAACLAADESGDFADECSGRRFVQRLSRVRRERQDQRPSWSRCRWTISARALWSSRRHSRA